MIAMTTGPIDRTALIAARQRNDRDAAVRASAFRREADKAAGDVAESQWVIRSVGYWR